MTVTLIVWDGVRKTVAFCKSLARSQHPQNKLCHVVTNHYKDPFVPGRLHIFFFVFLASLLERFMVIFQTDNVKIPFIEDELEQIIKQLARLVFKKST